MRKYIFNSLKLNIQITMNNWIKASQHYEYTMQIKSFIILKEH